MKKNHSTIFSMFFITIFLYPMLVVSITMIACTGSDDDDDEVNFDAYCPLDLGNIWYFVAMGDGEEGTGQAEVKPEQTFNNYDAIPLEVIDTTGQGMSGTLYLDADGRKADLLGGIGNIGTIVFDNPLRILSFPFDIGKTWDSSTSFDYEGFPVDIEATTTVQSREDITVQEITYTDCYRLYTDYTITITLVIPVTYSGYSTAWFFEGTGPVKAEFVIPYISYLPDIPSEAEIELTGTNF